MLLSLAKVKNPGPRLRDALKIPVTQHPGAQCMIQLLLLPELTNKPRSGSDEFQMSPCAHTRAEQDFLAVKDQSRITKYVKHTQIGLPRYPEHSTKIGKLPEPQTR